MDTIADLRVGLPRLLRRLIACDRVSVNEITTGVDCLLVLPSPLPPYWRRIGDFWVTHCREHPIWREVDAARVLPAVTFASFRHDRDWSRSPLHHEYYCPLGVRDQMATFIHQSGRHRVGIAFSRAIRDFTATERVTFDLIAPHIACAWRRVVIDRTASGFVHCIKNPRGEPRGVAGNAGVAAASSTWPEIREPSHRNLSPAAGAWPVSLAGGKPAAWPRKQKGSHQDAGTRKASTLRLCASAREVNPTAGAGPVSADGILPGSGQTPARDAAEGKRGLGSCGSPDRATFPSQL